MKTFRPWILPVLALALATSAVPLPGQPPAATVYDLTVVDKAPTPKKRIKPDYPSSLKKRATPAEITIRFIVTTEGQVTDINIVKFNDPDMVDPVYVAYEEARFEPGQKAGKPVNTRVEITEIFPEPKPAKKEKEKK